LLAEVEEAELLEISQTLAMEELVVEGLAEIQIPTVLLEQQTLVAVEVAEVTLMECVLATVATVARV
jgi:hypothetical protein